MFCIPNTTSELCNRRYTVMNLLSNKELQVVYKPRLAGKLSPILDCLEDGWESVEELWSTLKSTIHEVAMETIGERPQMAQGHLLQVSKPNYCQSISSNLGRTSKLHMTHILLQYWEVGERTCWRGYTDSWKNMQWPLGMTRWRQWYK